MAEYYEKKEQKKPLFGIKQLGDVVATIGNDTDPIRLLQANIFAGAGSLEIFTQGQGQASANQQPGWESWGKDQRQAMREIIRVNKVDVSTHAPIGGVVLSGFDLRSGTFDEENRTKSIEEIKKAIDFSSEVATGGAVVVHAGEFKRALSSNRPNIYWKDSSLDVSFQTHKDEKKDMVYGIVDQKSGKIANVVAEDMVIVTPIVETDANGHIVYLQDELKKPVIDETIKSGLLSAFKERFGSDFEKYPEYIKEKAYVKKYKYNSKTNEIENRSETFAQYKDRRTKEFKQMKGVSFKNDAQLFDEVVLDFVYENRIQQSQQELAQISRYGGSYEEIVKERQTIEKEYDFYLKLKKQLTADEWEMQSREFKTKFGLTKRAVDDAVDPLDFLKKRLDENKEQFLQVQHVVAGAKSRIVQQLEQLGHFTSVDEFALQKTTDSIVQLANYAYDKTRSAQKNRPSDPIKPICISVENIFPQMGGLDFGSHPDELKELIDRGRKAFAKDLQESRNVSESKAKELAKQHIGATIDTGHLNIWKKHLVRKKGESDDEFDDRFKKWFTTKVDQLAKDGYVTNVHLADNFGYDDVHQTPGQGNAPVKEVLEILHKHKYAGKIQAEGGWGPGQTKGLFSNWKLAGASIYRQGTDSWVNPSSRFYSVQHGYLDKPSRPTFVFGGYSPSSEEWKGWSGTRME
jgi:sugar phosphate isomerase/epimerase